WPFDIIPRVIPAEEWHATAEGLKQRLRALNCFIDDVYNDQKILKNGIVPREIIENSRDFRPECRGFSPRYGAWAHICGTDLVRDRDGKFYVLEDNLRVPSGVSYMLENRQLMKRVFPEQFAAYEVLPVDDYPSALYETLASLSPRAGDFPVIAVLTPGIYNSAYFEHSYLAHQMGAELVEGQDLVVCEDDCVYMKTVQGLSRVDVIYRRIDDAFLDPEVFRPDSSLGVPGIMRAWRAGNVALANAPGTGVADDKVVYAYVDRMIKYYLDEDPKVPNVPTFLCADPKDRAHVLANLDKLVVKPANESGGYGMLVGPHSTKAQHETFARLIKENPRNYVAQPTLALSTVPTLSSKGIGPRHVDLRPFILQGSESYVTTGGLCRVAMREGSLVVNSSQGGGSKDTWVVNEEYAR
ncbi:MAG: circularly permuted type 2 ATP-grasp protein, partial [Chromatiales bacterium]|nr:circularly permuted type 2 ATP-grasp protein [Chromatiales bacterium]